MVTNSRAILLISCQDKPGIVAKLTTLLYMNGANIVSSDQYTTDPVNGMFFMRIEFDIPNIDEKLGDLEDKLDSLSKEVMFDWKLSLPNKVKRMAILVSKEDHCLLELLWQWRSGDLPVEIPMIISNHENSRETAEQWGIPYHYLPVTKDNKSEVEKKQIELLKGNVDFIVLARYMQILTPTFVEQFPNQIINIHHSFLPAFIGAKPYERAYQRGVKIIGATAHYVNDQLDEGPIIEQDVQRVTHNESAKELKNIGKHIERIVLARAVKWHTEDRIIINENKTVVFH
ncbi:formyltetrahydrofolate deformylase [Paenibacillus thermotolerans]|uniref:formyltetrahydrofolate deformylase n=1 Tax=Paenibacillus thermotolerans TaxID=3027807 RepID=UPI00236774D5|nr:MULTISPECIES: formyltetrahydrofolate deformylase [unclassified Paenibacillus]